MDFQKRVDSLQQVVNDVLGLLQPKPDPSTRSSQRRTPQTNMIIRQLDQISKSLTQLKEDLDCLESAGEGGNLTQEQAHGIATSGTSLFADGGDSQSGGDEGSSAGSIFRMVDMGFGLVKSLGRYGTDFAGKIHISDLGCFDLISISKRLATPDPNACSSLFVQHLSSSENGSSELVIVRGKGFDFPDFSEPPQLPQEHEKSFGNIIASHPQEPLVYYVGPPLAPDFNPLLSPGNLLELGEIPGVNTPYWHVGEKGSGTAFHYEDAAVRSCNVTIAGFKCWILIDVCSNDEFEKFVTSLKPSATKQPRCGQWLRHLNILISPEKLTEKGIKFDLVLAGPGDMVVTAPYQYHAVLNLTACFAIAINFALPEDPLLLPTLVCSECGLYKLEHTAVKQVERQGARRALPAGGQKQHRSSTQPVAQTAALEPTGSVLGQDILFGNTAASVGPAIRGAGSKSSPDEASNSSVADGDETADEAQVDDATSDNTSEQNEDQEDIAPDENDSEATSRQGDSPSVAASPPPPPVDSSTPNPGRPGLKRVASSRQVLKRSKQRLSPPFENDTRLTVQNFDRLSSPSGISKGVQVFHLIRSRYAVKQFYNMVGTKRNLQVHKAFTSVQKSAARRLRVMETVGTSYKTLRNLNQYLFATEIEKMRCDMQRLDSSSKQRVLQDSGLSENQYHYNQRAGDSWRRLCGRFDGILCFLPVEKCFDWQLPHKEYARMDESELAELHSLLGDGYTMDLCAAGKAFQRSLGGRDVYFTWETTNSDEPLHDLPDESSRSLNVKPMQLLQEDVLNAAEFPNWPDPWAIRPNEIQCYCSSESCNCYGSKTSEAKLRIMAYPGKQLHLQAVSEEPKAVIYKTTGLLGFLTGKLVPPGTLDDDDWVFDTEKCQVDCRDESNEFRLLHHACQVHAVARLTEMAVSGRIRLAVVARKDICDGEKITISFERGRKTCADCEDGG